MGLQLKPTLVWDVEAEDTKREDENWADYRQRAGVAVAVVYEVERGLWEVYDRNQLGHLARRLEGAGDVVSFNGVWFDHVVLDNALGRRVFIPQETDLWQIIKESSSRSWPKGSWKLDAVCTRTLGMGKTGEGEFAPQLMQEGRIGELVTYCARDVWLTWRLWEFMRTYGYVLDPDDAKLAVGRPVVISGAS